MNELVTNLFKSLIDNGYKYITSVSNTFIAFKVNDKHYSIGLTNSKYKEVEPIKFESTREGFNLIPYNPPTDIHETNETVFVICYEFRQMHVKLSRVEQAEYLDKIEALANKWFEDQMISTINIIENDTFEDSVD